MSNTRVVRSLLIALLVAVCAIVAVPVSRAQISGDGSNQIFDPTQVNPMLLLRQRLSQSSLAAPGIPFEGAVDEEEYTIGPGDSFIFSINGQDITGAPSAVGADGRIALPDAGLIDVGGLTLVEARASMISALSRSFAQSDIDISLVLSRQFYVHVAGAVPLPGRYLALPVARVSNAVEYAFADTTSLPVTNSSFQPSLRNIEVQHSDGSISKVDLVRYFSTGNKDSNPYLQDGDVVYVPAHNPEYTSISVGGYVPYPGTYDFREGDRLDHILDVAGTSGSVDGADRVRVSRTTDAGVQTFSFSIAEATGSQGSMFEIAALDVISVMEKVSERGLISVDGRVEFPGTYPIVDGVSTLRDLLNAAGGLQDDALARGIYLERRSLPDPIDLFAANRFEDQTLAYEQVLAADTTAILQRLRLTDLDFLSRAYFAQELRIQNRVSLDIESTLDGSADPVYLRSGDRLVVPRDMNTVYIFGQVNQPGYIPLSPGENAEYYIMKAGGRAENANQVLIINPSTGRFTENLSQTLESGDILFIDRVVDLADSPEMQRLVIEADRLKSDARIRTMQTILQSVGTLASVVALVISIRRN